MVAAAVGGSAIVGAGSSLLGANKAANAQKDAATQASDTQRQMFDVTQENLYPYNVAGGHAVDLLNGRINELTSPVNMDEATLRNTPGYQFNLQQGTKAAQNSASARGLGLSGAAIKGATNYATGLADSTYQNQFQNAITNQGNAYNRLLSLAGLGENAAAGVGNAAVTTGQNIGNNLTSAGNAQGASYIAGANGVTNAANSLSSGYLTNQLLQNGLYGGGSGSSGYGSSFFDDL